MFALLRFLFSGRRQVDKHTVPFEHSRGNLQLPLHLPLKPFAPLCYFLSSLFLALYFFFFFFPSVRTHLLPTFLTAQTLGARLNAHANLILFLLVLSDSIRFKLSFVFFFIIILFTVTVLPLFASLASSRVYRIKFSSPKEAATTDHWTLLQLATVIACFLSLFPAQTVTVNVLSFFH